VYKPKFIKVPYLDARTCMLLACYAGEPQIAEQDVFASDVNAVAVAETQRRPQNYTLSWEVFFYLSPSEVGTNLSRSQCRRRLWAVFAELCLFFCVPTWIRGL